MTRRLIVSVLVAVMLLMAVALVVSAQTEQFWYLDDDVSTAGRIMYKDTPTPTSTVAISDGTSEIWRADETSQECTFPADTWGGTIRFTSAPPSGTNTITLEVGYWDSSFHSHGSQNLSPTGSKTVFVTGIDASQFNVSSGDYLAFRVTNNTEGAITVDTGGGGQSNLTSPPTDPGYPIPELPTIVLLATGLVCLAGYLGLKKPKRVYLKV